MFTFICIIGRKIGWRETGLECD